MNYKYYEIFINHDYAICIKVDKIEEPTKEDVYNYLKQYEENARQYDFSINDIHTIKQITEQKSYDLYNMEYINTLPIMQ